MVQSMVPLLQLAINIPPYKLIKEVNKWVGTPNSYSVVFYMLKLFLHKAWVIIILENLPVKNL